MPTSQRMLFSLGLILLTTLTVKASPPGWKRVDGSDRLIVSDVESKIVQYLEGKVKSEPGYKTVVTLGEVNVEKQEILAGNVLYKFEWKKTSYETKCIAEDKTKCNAQNEKTVTEEKHCTATWWKQLWNMTVGSQFDEYPTCQ